MTRLEYRKKIDRIRRKVREEKLKGIGPKLDELFRIKPVRLIWFVAKAEYLFVSGHPMREVFELLSGRFDFNSVAPELQDILSLYVEHARKRDDQPDKRRHLYRKEMLEQKHAQGEVAQISHRLQQDLTVARERFSKDVHDSKAIAALRALYYASENIVIYTLFCHLYNNLPTVAPVPPREWIFNSANMGYLNERIQDEEPQTFVVLVTEDSDDADCRIAAHALSRFGHQVFLLSKPLAFEVESDLDVKNSLLCSLDNAEVFEDITLIPPAEIICQGEHKGDNRGYLLSHITQSATEDGLVHILCSGKLMTALCETPLLRKNIQRLSNYRENVLEEKMAFGYFGNYLAYIEKLYNFDPENSIHQPASCDISIVIPARNSADSLRYTLQTCLDQQYNGTYEIVLSDNSVDGNTAVYDLYCELNDTRIRYFKTPRNLPLSRSFEFAFLHARGSFIFSIGSDDAVLPWGLETIAMALKEIPKDEILMWDRGFYAWPGFNRGQQHQFVIPENYTKNSFKVVQVSSNEALALILSDPNYMYNLPMLYINSGFKRSYLQTLLSKTGRLWDGVCQDLYMGIVNLAINDHFPLLKYPITIAGMTMASMGRVSNQAMQGVEQANQDVGARRQSDNVGGYIGMPLESLIPSYKTDRASLYKSLCRLIARGNLPQELLGKLDWKQVYLRLAEQLSIEDVQLDMKLCLLQRAATLAGKDAAKFVDETIVPKLTTPRIIASTSEDTQNQRTYSEGFMSTGGLTLDASKFGVKNVYEAVQLFEKIMGYKR